MEYLFQFLTKHWEMLISVIGGALITRLWVGCKFRRHAKKELEKLPRVQSSYDFLCWRDFSKGIFLPNEKGTVINLGQFSWGEYILPLKMCRWLFTKEDRDAIERFISLEKVFKEQPNYLEMQTADGFKQYRQYIIHHLWCLNFMKNIGELGTNKTTIDTNNVGYDSMLQVKFKINTDYQKCVDKTASENQRKKIGLYPH